MTKRLESLDVMRGLTVFLMILVNNGVGHEQFTTLQHSKWDGMTLCDLVFPFFLFMVGVSIWLAHKRLTPQKVLSRTIKLFLVGVLLHVWDMLLDGQWVFWHELRIWGVLQRIALCYGISALMVLYLKPRQWIIFITTALIGYTILLHFGNGYAQDTSNWLCKVDRWIFGEAHLYHKSPIDPEGLLSTLPAVAHTLIGTIIGMLITSSNPDDSTDSLRFSKSIAVTLFFMGLAISIWLPLNKRIWSPSYVLVTCGLATLLLLLLVWLIDMEGNKRWCRVFQMFGLNAFFLYVLSEMLAPVMSRFGVNQKIYEALLSGGIDPRMASLCYALLFNGIIATVAWALWRRKIFVKI